MITREIIHTGLQPSLEEFKAHLRITSNDLDAELSAKLKAAIMAAEHEVGMVIAKSRYTRSGTFAQSVDLKYPYISVESVSVDGSAVLAANYTISENEDRDAVTLTFASGVSGSEMEVVYLAGKDEVEWDIKAAILLSAAKLFNNPVDAVETLPTQAKNLLRPYRSWGLKHNGN